MISSTVNKTAPAPEAEISLDNSALSLYSPGINHIAVTIELTVAIYG
jgi:hypothetical protein